MKSTGAIQVVAILLLVASAASCEVAKEYSNRVFKPAIPQKKPDSTATALKFMQFDSGNASDSIDLKDFADKEIKENDKPEVLKDASKTEVAVIENKVIPRENEKPEVQRDTSKTDIAVIENKVISKEQPIDATKKGAARTRRVRQ